MDSVIKLYTPIEVLVAFFGAIIIFMVFPPIMRWFGHWFAEIIPYKTIVRYNYRKLRRR